MKKALLIILWFGAMSFLCARISVVSVSFCSGLAVASLIFTISWITECRDHASSLKNTRKRLESMLDRVDGVQAQVYGIEVESAGDLPSALSKS